MNLRQRNEQGVLELGVIDLYSNGKEDAILPYPMQPHATNKAWTNHADNIIKIIRSFVPNAIIYLVRHDSRGIQYLIDKGVAIVSMSLAGQAEQPMEYPLANKSFLVCGAGNDGDRGESWSARQEFWCGVGAIDKDLSPRYYSSFGKGAVTTCGITPTVDGKILEGTSFTTPVVAGLLAQWYIWYFDIFNRYPSIAETNNFIKVNSHDVFEEGKDLRTGYGLLRLPRKFEATDIVVRIGNRIGNKIKYVEGETPTEKAIDLLIEPSLYKSRTLVGLNGMATNFGYNVIWDGENQLIHNVK